MKDEIWDSLKNDDIIVCNEEIKSLLSLYNKRLSDILEIKHMLMMIKNHRYLTYCNSKIISRLMSHNAHSNDFDFIDYSLRNSIWNDIKQST